MNKYKIIFSVLLFGSHGISSAMEFEQSPESGPTAQEQELGLRKSNFSDSFMYTLFTTYPENTQKQLNSIMFRLTSKQCIPPSCIIFEGAPGIGKTTLAQAIAQKTGRCFKLINATDLFTKFQNSGAENLRKEIEPFLTTKTPIIIIIDEITRITMYHNDEHKKEFDAAMQLWLILDACEHNKNICVIGTTNDSSNIPEPIKQRLGAAIIALPKPTIAAVENVLSHYIVDSSINSLRIGLKDVTSLARQIGPVSPRVVEKIFNEAFNNAIEENPTEPELMLKHFADPVQKLKKPGTYDNIKMALIYARNNKLKIAKESLPYITAIGVATGIYFNIKGNAIAIANQQHQLAAQEAAKIAQKDSLDMSQKMLGLQQKSAALQEDSAKWQKGSIMWSIAGYVIPRPVIFGS